jgi:hypothetical protein
MYENKTHRELANVFSNGGTISGRPFAAADLLSSFIDYVMDCLDHDIRAIILDVVPAPFCN